MTKRLFSKQLDLMSQARLIEVTGQIVEVSGLAIVAVGLRLPVGASCTIQTSTRASVAAQVVGFRGKTTVLMPLADASGIAPGNRVTSASSMEYVEVGHSLLGRVVNGLGQPMDGHGICRTEAHYAVYGKAPGALERRAITESVATGVRSIDALHTLGRGQRMGLFAGTGVGKSILLGMIARQTEADVSVIALIGERGREVGDFLRKELDDQALRRTVMVVSTSDESPVLRVRACFVATAIAEFFRDQRLNVLLLMDSVTRCAMAQRQIGLAAGEPPTTKGYPPSVFALFPRLLERAGTTEKGSITGIYTVLVEGDDIGEPVADALRGYLDGHVWLSRSLANAGHYPPVSTLESISRVMRDVVDEEHQSAASSIRRVLSVWSDIEDLVNIGAYAKGSNPTFDLAVETKPDVDRFLQQRIDERSSAGETRMSMMKLNERIQTAAGRLGCQLDASQTRPTPA